MHRFRRFISFLFAPAFLLSTVPAYALSMPTLSVETQALGAGSVPQGAQRVEFLQMTLTASCDEAIPLESITLHHRGLGDRADIEGLSLWLHSLRISPSVTPEARDGNATLRPRRLVIPACKTVQLSVRGSLSPDAAAGGQHAFVLASHDDVHIGSNAIVAHSTSESFSPSQTTPSPSASAEIEVTMLPVTGSVTFGAGRTVARLQMRSTGSRTQRVTRLVLTNDGSARDADLRNLSLLTSARKVISGTVAQMTDDKVIFDFTEPIVFDGTDTRLFTLRADVRASRKRTIDFIVEDPSDVEASVCSGARSCAQAY